LPSRDKDEDRSAGDSAARERATVFEREFREDLRWWAETQPRVALRALALVEATVRDPFGGVGKPEHLRFQGANVWSRRITQEHRLVYVVGDERISFLQCRYHY
jgi:toxin YoeB